MGVYTRREDCIWTPHFFSFCSPLSPSAIFVVVQVGAARRRKMLAAWAAARAGSSSLRSMTATSPYRHSFFDCFNKGHDRYADNVAQGQIGTYKLCAFDYHYDTGSGKSQTHAPLFGRHCHDEPAAQAAMDPARDDSSTASRALVGLRTHRVRVGGVQPGVSRHLARSPLGLRRFAAEHDGVPARFAEVHHRIAALPDLGLSREPLQPADFDAAIEVIDGILRRLPASLVQELQGTDQ